jgi:prepilin signal peptidase PulO-like enzyme (type II secretory pathway)
MLAASALYAGALVLLLSACDSLGYGDVKALAYQGLYAGYVGWGRVLGALLLTFIAAAAAALALRAVRSWRVRPRLAFAPCVLGATLAAVLA